MKVGILSESPADEAAIQILAAAVLRCAVEVVQPRRVRAGGWASVVQNSAIYLKHYHYQTDVEGMIIVVDSDDTHAHDPSHVVQPHVGCRVCEIEATLGQVQSSLTRRASGSAVRIAIGLPVPAIEAWFRCGSDPHAAESRFVRDLQNGQLLTSARQQVNRDVYGTDRPSLKQEMEAAVREANRLATDIDRLRAQFPRGFGMFYESLFSWR